MCAGNFFQRGDVLRRNFILLYFNVFLSLLISSFNAFSVNLFNLVPIKCIYLFKFICFWACRICLWFFPIWIIRHVCLLWTKKNKNIIINKVSKRRSNLKASSLPHSKIFLASLNTHLLLFFWCLKFIFPPNKELTMCSDKDEDGAKGWTLCWLAYYFPVIFYSLLT